MFNNVINFAIIILKEMILRNSLQLTKRCCEKLSQVQSYSQIDIFQHSLQEVVSEIEKVLEI